MGRREILSGALLALFALGGAAAVASVTTPASYWTPVLEWGGILAILLSGTGLIWLYYTSPSGGRIFARPKVYLTPELTAEVLMDKIKGRTRVQIRAITKTYLGKWLRHEGKVRDVAYVYSNKWVVHVDIEGISGLVSAYFGKSDYERLMTLNRGDWITVEGKISKLEYGPSLERAEILHVGKGPTPPTTRKRQPRQAKTSKQSA